NTAGSLLHRTPWRRSNRRKRTPPSTKQAAAGKGALESQRVSVFQSTAGRKSVGDAGDSHSERREHFGDKMRGRLTFHIGTKGQDDLAGRVGLHAGDEFANAELIGADVVERRQASAQHM